jgi:Pyruvate/2-oxoacid:ferredoxin oxidoreductase delta subunit
MLREIVEVDEALCDGCGDCVPSCAEGALQVVNGKVRLVGDVLCDGLGACLGECPKGALKVVRRDVAPFDEHAVEVHLRAARPPARRPSLAVMQAPAEAAGGGCPGSRSREIARPAPRAPAAADGAATPSALAHWPVQIELVSPRAPWLAGADLLVAADCVPFAYADFHRDYLAGRKVLVGCPKLDDVSGWVERLAAVIREGAPRSVTVVRMEVPCCGGIARAVREAVAASGRAVPLAESTVSVDGCRLA